MKVALCFIISYEHELNKEEIWREWIDYNKDIINIYFHYKDYSKIKSEWIKKYVIPDKFIAKTSYYHVIPAYMSLLSYAYLCNKENKWFCILTDSCVPIISPSEFRSLFFENYQRTIMSWKYAWWDVEFHKRANLRLLPKEFRLGHEPWFVIDRNNLEIVINYQKKFFKNFKLICDGGLANESLFAIIFKYYKKLDWVINETTTLTNWEKMSSPTSPYVFKNGDDEELKFIDDFFTKNNYVMFMRKVHKDFPDIILREIIYKKNKNKNTNNNYITTENVTIGILIFSLYFLYFYYKLTYFFGDY